MLRSPLMLGLVLVTAASVADLVKNPGFEEADEEGRPSGWGGPVHVYSRDATVARSGKASLKFVNNNPDDYALCGRSVDLEQGRMYEISVWVKTEGIEGEDSGATICVEWQDANGQYLGGHYPRGVKGDTDWTEVKSVTGRIPENAARCSVTCYVRKGMTGTAWWDDVSVRRFREAPLSVVLVEPNYRAEVTDDGPMDARIRALCNLTDYDITFDDVALTWRVVEGESGQAVREGMAIPVKASTDLLVPVQDLAPGRYRVEVSLNDRKSQDVLDTKSVVLARKTGAPLRKAYIDRHNRLVLDGEPFFPLGMYWGSISEEELDIYAQSPFNCLMPYGAPTKEQMDLAHDRGLKVIYSVKDIYFGTKYCPKDIASREDELPFVKAKVEAFRDHPALMAWYINDELPLDMLDRLTLRRRRMEELDPHHPTWVVLYQVDRVRDYIPTFDVIGTDPYPIPNKPPATAGDWTRRTVGAVCGARPVWQVPQVFNWACYKKEDKDKYRPPTLEEMRSMAWQCIAEGANGLIFYSWFDIRRDPATPFKEHWPKVKAMAQEIKEMMPALLSIEPAAKVGVQSEDWLASLVKELGDVTYVVLVNNSSEERTAVVTFEARPAAMIERWSREELPVDSDGELRLVLAPLDVRIIEIRGIGQSK